MDFFHNFKNNKKKKEMSAEINYVNVKTINERKEPFI